MLSHLKWKIKGVTKRWLVNVMSVVVAVVIVVEVILGIFQLLALVSERPNALMTK